MLDSTIVNLALYPMARDLGVSISLVQWVIIAYTLVLTVFLPFWGKVGDLVPKNKLYAFGFSLFAAGSFLNTIAQSLPFLILFRCIEALGASIIISNASSVIASLFKGKDLERIGPIRSSRHYFLDYALENDAIYAHYGWSPKAKTDISKLDVDNINGITESSSSFWRTKSKAAPHNVFTSTKKIKEIAENKGYSLTSDEESVLNYTFDEVNLEDGIDANTVTIPYSDLHTTSYKYDAETKRYVRYARGKKQTDYETKDPITTKNIIITFVENSRLNDGTKKDRQTIDNIGTCNGYYITNGKAIKIKCTKDSRKKQTVYKDLDGNEIEVNDGNTFFNICPIDSEVTFE